MILPDKWGQGAVFSYSAAKGKRSSTSLDAKLCGDRLALEFLTHNPCTLSIYCEDAKDITFDAVMTDYIKAIFKCKNADYSLELAFFSENTVLIKSNYAVVLSVVFAKSASVKKSGKTIIYSSDEETFALSEKKKNGTVTYSFSYGVNAQTQAEDALNSDFDTEADKKISSYETYTEFRIPNDSIEKLYYRCASILFACINSPEGLIKSRYISPSPVGTKSVHSFYSAICTLGLRHISPAIAKETLETILASQAGDGMIPAQIYTNEKSSDIAPPVLAWCLWELYQVNNDKEMLSSAYSSLKKYIHYITETRDINKNQLFEWQISDDCEQSGIESTMDNSPRFDDGTILDSVDFSSYVANEAYHMSLIAEEIDRHGESLYWNVMFERIKTATNELLFDEDDKIYYDRAVVSNMLKKVKTSASFLPIFAGICENRHAMALLKHLNSNDRFNRKYGVPSVSADSEEYSCDMWRGPVHIYMNYFISKGLDKYQMNDKSNEIKAKSFDAVMNEFENSGVVYEYYSADGNKTCKNLSKKGSGISGFIMSPESVNMCDYAPTAAMIIDMLLSRSKKIPLKI